jgi:hypothetical protein
MIKIIKMSKFLIIFSIKVIYEIFRISIVNKF